MTITLPLIDLSTLDGDAQAAAIQQQIATETMQPFDLSRDPMLRGRLLQLGGTVDQTEHILLMTMHHIASDIWSWGIVVKELAALYAAFCQGQPSPLPDLPLQYADFAVWQRDYLQGDVLDKHLGYWKAQLANAPELLQLPTDRPRPATQSYQGDVVALRLDAQLSQQLRTFSRQQGVTLYMTLLAAFQVLLVRYSGQTDIVVGSVIANRNRPEIEALIGFFVNTLALRMDLSEPGADGALKPLSFLAVLDQVRELVQAAYEHQDLPFERVVEEVLSTRSLNYNPLVQVMFALQNAPMDAFELAGLQVTPIELPAQTTRFDLEMHVWEVDDCLEAECVYSTDLFDRATIARLVGHFETLLRAIIADPTQSITKLPLLTENEQQQLLVGWNKTATDYPKGKCIHQLFEEQAARTPDAIAVVFADEQLTYRALNERANQLAHYLQAFGVGAETLVGICVERSVEMVVGLLGILKAGGAYVPLDTSYPEERLAFMLDDTQAPVLITQQHFVHLFTTTQAEIVLLDRWQDKIARQPTTNLKSSYRSASPAYVIYTSGSTGVPKGVIIPHYAINRLICNTNYVDIQPTDRIAQASNASFDAATFEIWGALGHGATLVGIPRNVTLEPREMAHYLREQEISILFLTTALFNQIVLAVPDAFATLRYLLFGGEAVAPVTVRKVLEQGCPNHLLHVYGPTEGTTFSTWYPVQSVPEQAITVPIGGPLSNTQLYVLDSQLQSVPIGIVGELYIGGDGLALEYHKRPELTAERFISNPFASQNQSEWLYKTGDLVRWLANGTIEFLGRIDNQVKIRGFRIELGEIEACLSQHPAVREVTVVVDHVAHQSDGDPTRVNGAADKRRIAYVVGDAPIDVAELRAALARQLPDYMIPAAFVQLDAMPLTANGKIDRRALPPPDLAATLTTADFVPPSTPTERALTAIWCDLLGLEQVGIHDNFFELGGHSLLATQVIARIRQTFAVDLGLRTLFATPTVAASARAIVDQQQQQIEATLLQAFPEIVPAPAQRHAPFPLTDVQHAYWIGRSGSFELGNVSAHVYFEVNASGLDIDRLNLAWQRLIERHEMLRAIIQADGQQRILATVPDYQFAVADLTAMAEATTEQALATIRNEMAHQVLPADQWPIFDIRVSRINQAETRLHISLDGLILDGSSMGILLTEWLHFYQHPQATLAPLTVSFRDYVFAERAFAESAQVQQAWRYWAARLDTLPPAPELPLQQEGQAIAKPHFHTHRFRLEQTQWDALKQYGHRVGLTDSTIILSAFAEVLAQWSKQAHFTLNLTLFNRLPLHPQIQEIVGDFTPLLMLEIDNRSSRATGDPKSASFAGRAQRIQQQLWDDLDHRVVNGVRVLRELAKRRSDRTGQALMPVVFTSMLATTYDHALFEPFGGLNYMCSQTPQVWLDHGVTEAGGALDLNWSVVADLFPDGLIEEMFAAYCQLLQHLATEEAAWQAAHLPLLPVAQQQQRATVNATAAAISDQLLHTLFLHQVADHAADPAVLSATKTLTYAELYQRALQVGHWLRERGARPNTLVAVPMEKGWEQIVAVLGIHLAGAAYLPLDPTLPTERLHYLLDQAEATIALTQSRLVAKIAWPAGVTHLAVDTLALETTLPPLDVVQTPTDLAYVIYTSGSTGLPKGVAIDHRGAVNTVLDVNQLYGITAADRVLALSALNFDLSVYDIFGLLAVGGAIVMPDADKRIDPSHWLDLINRYEVTVWDTVPALMQMLVDYCEQADRLDSRARQSQNGHAFSLSPTWAVSSLPLRVVMLSGDWIPVTLPDRIRQLWPKVHLYSMGGATEASIWSIYYPIAAVDPAWSSIPYGKPMTNQTFHVFDADLNPRPVWVPGDLYIGGIGVALGYWRDAVRTNASFITHPQTGERLYRTGDLGRYLPDGNIEFLGRNDFQVKIRGHRIELGEIENALLQHAAVDKAVVDAVGDPKGNRQLVAYVVRSPSANVPLAHQGANGSAQAANAAAHGWQSELQAYLATKLPAYMIPALYVELSITW